MVLYIDIGNTNIKLHWDKKYLNYDTKTDYSVDSFFNILPDELKNARPEKIVLCSVVPQKETLINDLSIKYWHKQPLLIAYPIKTGIKFKSNDPRSIGADLVALAAYVSSKAKEGIIVNMGTATTILYVKNETLEGAIIAPGIGISRNALISNAAKLAEMNLKATKELIIGKNTQEAISIGILKGHVKMVEGLVEDISKEIPVYVSGGHSEKVKELFTKNVTFVKEATLEGIKVIEKINS